MTIHAAYYGHNNGLFEGDCKPVVATKKKVAFIDLIRPDFYLNFNVDQIVGIFVWLKKEIKRVTPYSSRCDYFYQNCEKSHLVGKEWYNTISEIMLGIFLSRANGCGRGAFDKLYNLTTIRILPIRYHKTHAPIKWGESQLDLLKFITDPDKKLRFRTWYPNSSHKEARSIFARQLVVTADGFYYKMSYSSLNDMSSWSVIIFPQKKQALVDFMLDVKWWIGEGLKKQHLENYDPTMGRFSSRYKIKRVVEIKQIESTSG